MVREGCGDLVGDVTGAGMCSDSYRSGGASAKWYE